MSALISAQAATLSIKGSDQPVFGPLSLTIGQGDSLRISGQNGAGKTALMRHLAGLPGPVTGPVWRLPRLRIGFAFAEPRLLPALTVAENIALVMRRGAAGFVQKALAELNLGAIADTPARLISKGQAQRIALLRALAIGPQVLFLDEAVSGLDDENWALVAGQVLRMRAESGFAVVETSHDPQRLFAPGTEILVLTRKQV